MRTFDKLSAGPKRFNHFIVAGVIAMASAGLVTVNGSSLARTIRLADLSQIRTPASANGGEMRGAAGAREFAPEYRNVPQDNQNIHRQEPPSFMKMSEPRFDQFRDGPAVQREGTAGGSAMPESLGMDFLKNEKMMRMKEEMMKKAAGEQEGMQDHGMKPPAEGMSGNSQGQTQGAEKDMTKQFGSTVMQDIMRQFNQDQSSIDEDPCSAVDIAFTQKIQQLEGQSARRIEMYTANKAKTKSAAVQKMWQKRIDGEPEKLSDMEKKLDTKAEALRAKYGCTADAETDL